MDAMTDEERQYYDVIDKNRSKNNFDKKFFQNELMTRIEQFPENKIRQISRKFLYLTDDEGKCTGTENLKRQIVLSENEIVRRCRKDLQDVPLIFQIVIMKCKSELMVGVLKQIIDRGVDIDGVHYVFYTSSTNQMKNAEITLLEADFWNKNKSILMCGLTEEIINSKGGINMGKFFAAKALNMSNSIIYDDSVSIDDVIIVKDFKTVVQGMTNFLDVETLKITAEEKEVPIEHMDGAGIFIPGTFLCSCQIRGGWLKGAIFPFDFHKFIRKFKDKLSSEHMQDAWGNAIVVEDFLNAKMILTDSQLKMRKYYNSMEEYRQKFKESEQSITVNNWAYEPSKNGEVRVAYQPFQTIPRSNMTKEAIEKLTVKTENYINGAKTDPKIALKLMGVDVEIKEDNETDNEEVADENEVIAKEINVLFASILKCPELLNDVHVRKVMQSALLSERNKAMGCKLIMDGIWSYVCPDLFAFCQWLFLGDDDPVGLVPNGYVYNNYYKNKDILEVCCIRYPHLSDCEHAIRKIEKSDECAEWFSGYDTIVSCHDMISKVLQCDWDGDHICLVHDESFLSVLDRNTFPLFYEMTKAEPSEVNNDRIMICLTSSFNNENIGFVSNAITKIFNSAGKPDIKLVRILCAYNNFVIDYFKTQKKMDLKQYEDDYVKYKSSDSKCPYFFRYAKKKSKDKCADYNSSSNCDRISKHVKDNTRKNITKTVMTGESEEKFNPEVLTSKCKIKRSTVEYQKLRKLIVKLKTIGKYRYKRINEQIRNSNTLEEKFADDELFYFDCAYQIGKIINDRSKAADYLVDIEYYQEENCDDKKDILWNCYGDILYENLCRNVKDGHGNTPVKRNAYQSSAEKIEAVEECIKKAELEIVNTESVPISKTEYENIMGIQSRKDRQNDKYILFIIYVLLKRFQKKYDESQDYIKIYKGSKKKGKITRATVDNWIGSDCTDKGLKQLEKSGYIKKEECKKYTKVYFTMNLRKDDSEIFCVGSYNPLVDLFRYNKDRKTMKCKNCGRWFIASGNTKTCSDECSDLNRKLNKNNDN